METELIIFGSLVRKVRVVVQDALGWKLLILLSYLEVFQGKGKSQKTCAWGHIYQKHIR